MTQQNLNWIIQQQRNELDALEKRVRILENKFAEGAIHIVDLSINLPNHLRQSLIAIQHLDGKVTAKQISEITKKARAVESAYLNILVNMHVLSKSRIGQEVYFALNDDNQIKGST